MSCEKKLQHLIYDNFTSFFNAQTAHLNVTGKTFLSDHQLFGTVYETLYTWHDKLSEQQRAMGYPCNGNLQDFYEDNIVKRPSQTGKRDDLVQGVLGNILDLEGAAQSLYMEAGKEKHGGLETLIGDYLVDLSTLKYKLRSSL